MSDTEYTLVIRFTEGLADVMRLLCAAQRMGVRVTGMSALLKRPAGFPDAVVLTCVCSARTEQLLQARIRRLVSVLDVASTVRAQKAVSHASMRVSSSSTTVTSRHRSSVAG